MIMTKLRIEQIVEERYSETEMLVRYRVYDDAWTNPDINSDDPLVHLVSELSFHDRLENIDTRLAEEIKIIRERHKLRIQSPPGLSTPMKKFTVDLDTGEVE